MAVTAVCVEIFVFSPYSERYCVTTWRLVRFEWATRKFNPVGAELIQICEDHLGDSIMSSLRVNLLNNVMEQADYVKPWCFS